MAMFWIILTIYIFYIFLEFFLTMFDKSVKVWMRESVWKCKRTVKLTLAQNMPTFAPKARRLAFIRTRTAHARPSSLKKIFTFSSVLFNLFLWLNLILTSGAVLHLHLGWYYSNSFLVTWLRRTLSSGIHFTAKARRSWKWSNGVKISEMGIV